jgi:hypothetical protein
MTARRCRAVVLVGSGREVRCTGRLGHGPTEDMHQGLLRVTLPDGRAHAASLVWSTSPSPAERELLDRAD